MGSLSGQRGSVLKVSWGVLTAARLLLLLSSLLLLLGSICRPFGTGVQRMGEGDGKHTDRGRYAETVG